MKFMLLTYGLALLTITGVLGIVRLEEPTHSPFIMFERNPDIYMMDYDGSEPRNMTRSLPQFGYAKESPYWSPDGLGIAFATRGVIYRMRTGGHDQRPLIADAGANWSPVWSPDGQWIAFQSNRDGNPEIYRARPDGSNPRNLTHNPTHDGSPSWSPDGQWIAFDSLRNGKRGIFRMRSDGSEQQHLVDISTNRLYIAWSPDGAWILFTSNGEGTDEIYRVRSDGSDLQNLTNNPYTHDVSPSWSPDGEWIVFASHNARENVPGSDLYVMRADGSELRNLTESAALDWSPSWSPDGEWIMYLSGNDVFRIHPDGTGRQNLTHSRIYNIQLGSSPYAPPIDLPWRGWLNFICGAVLVGAGMRVRKRRQG